MIYVKIPIEIEQTFTVAGLDFVKARIMETGSLATFKAQDILYEGGARGEIQTATKTQKNSETA